MGEVTGISWAHATLNFWIGCTKVGTACEHCYAEAWGHRFGVDWGPHAPRRRCVNTRAKARKLERLAATSGAPFFCFSNSLSDIFDNAVPIEWLAAAFADMQAAPHVTFLLLTKRPQNIVKRSIAAGGLPPNAAIGCTVVTQEEAERDIPVLLAAKRRLRPPFAFVSMEPLCGPVDLTALDINGDGEMDALRPYSDAQARRDWGEDDAPGHPALDWVICGGESGPEARPTHAHWLRALRDQCAGAGVAFHFKQWGEWAPLGAWAPAAAAELAAEEDPDHPDEPWRVGRAHSGRRLDGVLHDAMPAIGVRP